MINRSIQLSVALSLTLIGQALIHATAHSAVSCQKAFAERPKQHRDIWKESKIDVPDLKAKDRHIRFSFDSETSTANVIRFIRQTTEGEKTLATLFKGHRIDRNKAIEVSELSPAQFARFAIRKGVDPQSSRFELNDLNADLLGKLIEIHDRKAPESVRFFEDLVEMMETHLQERGFPFKAGQDLGFVEVRHETSESSPARFKKSIQDYHRAVGRTNSHFHVSLPGEIPHATLVNVVRAVETKIVLRLLQENSQGEISFLNGTSLTESPQGVFKSIVSFTPNRFRQPFQSHDIEIRQHVSLETAFDDLALVAELGRNHKSVKEISKDWTRAQLEPGFGNTKMALLYAAQALKLSPATENQRIGRAMEKMAMQIESNSRGVISAETHEKIAEFLQQYEVIDRLQPELFLE